MFKKIYRKINEEAEESFPSTYLALYKRKLLVKYFISGGITALVDLVSLYILAEYVLSPDLYMLSIAIAFLIAFFAGFFLQKFWTFKDKHIEGMVNQMAIYMTIAVINLGFNFVAVVFLVEALDFWYFYAQIIAGAMLAAVSFVLYNRFVFRDSVVKGSVLIASGIFPPDVGGPATHTNRFLRGFSGEGIKIGVITYSDVKEHPKTDEGYEVERVSRRYPFGVRHLVYFFRLLFMSLNYDIIYAQDITAAGVPAMAASFLLNRRFILRVGGDILWERVAEKGKTKLSLVNFYKENKHLKYYLYHVGQSVLMRAGKVIVPTDLLANIYKNYYGIDASNIIVFPNPLPTLVSKREGDPLIEKNIIFAGRFVKYKNLERLILAFANIYKEIGPAKLILVGEGPEKGDLVKLAKDLNLKDQIIFKDKVPHNELIDEIEKASLCVGPALTEFNPNFILECLSLSKPILLTRENGLSIKIPVRFLIDSLDIKDIEDKIVDTLSLSGKASPELLDAIKSSKIVSWDDIIKRHLELFKTI